MSSLDRRSTRILSISMPEATGPERGATRQEGAGHAKRSTVSDRSAGGCRCHNEIELQSGSEEPGNAAEGRCP